jgi:DNA polymerase beta
MDYTNNTKIKNPKTKTKKRPPLDFFLEALQLGAPPPQTYKNTTVSAKMRRCKRGTRKFVPLGPDCYTQAEINIYKKNSLKKQSPLSMSPLSLSPLSLSPLSSPLIASPVVSELDANPNPITVEIAVKQQPPPKKLKKPKNVSAKRRLKIPVELVEVEQPMIGSEEIKKEKETRYNEAFIELMEQLSAIMLKQGEPFRARAYQKAQETIMAYPDDILSPKQLEGQPGIGSTIMEKLNEYVATGTLRVLEREKTNPINILADVYGIGPKKAAELVAADVKTIETLRQRQDELLNDVQKVGLKYYEQIQERIPRSEIEEFNHVFESVFSKVAANSPGAKYEIVGSYRRGAQTSGDIDVIITGSSNDIYTRFINELLKTGVIVEVLSRGQSKTLVIAKLPDKPIARRVDFLFAPPNEFAFAILYFTGSKIFNTVMRQRALNQGYTFNEHGIYHLENKKKGEKVEQAFQSEKDIFDFLGLQFKEPNERKDGRSIVGKKTEPIEAAPTQIVEPKNDAVEETIIPVKKNRTLKKRAKVATKVEEVKQNTDTSLLTLLDSFKQNGISVLQHLSEQELANIIQFANTQYYNEQPVLTDNQYDIMREFAEAKFPNNANIQAIGADVERNKA